MKTAVVYASKYGTTERCAEKLAETIGGGSEAIRLSTGRRPDISAFDAIVVGGPIYGGRILPAVTEFCESAEDELTRKPLGLFICCFRTGPEADAQLHAAFPAALAAHARVKDVFGGAVDFDRLKLMDRLIMKAVAKLKESVDRIKEDRVVLMAESFRS